MNTKTQFFGLVMAVAMSTGAIAGSNQCPQFFYNGQLPVVTNGKMKVKTRMLCNESFAVLNSGITRSGLYSAELLTPEGLEAGRGLKRQNAFHPDERVPEDERAELKDFARSGYDRGHLTPSADAVSQTSQYETFSLSNMVPQHPANNRGIWEGVESSVRKLVQQNGRLFVITGPLYEGSNLQRIGGRVLVPTAIYKAVYDPVRQRGAAYVTDNGPGNAWKAVTLEEIERRSGTVLFPAVSASIKTQLMDLPTPKPHGYDKGYRETSATSPTAQTGMKGLIGAWKYFSRSH